MNRQNEIELLRLLHGELEPGEVRRLEARMVDDDALRAAFARLKRRWEGLELPDPASAPPGFAASVLERVRWKGGGVKPVFWAAHPTLGRTATVAAFAGGILLGALLVEWGEAVEPQEYSYIESSLAEIYWSALEEVTQ